MKSVANLVLALPTADRNQYGVLVFRNTGLDGKVTKAGTFYNHLAYCTQRQIAFAANFGDLDDMEPISKQAVK
jgi:hypothetical protein